MRLLCLSSIFLLLGFLPSKGSAIRCYSCNSAYDPGCGDPINVYSLGYVNCSWKVKPDYLSQYESNVCRKFVQHVQGKTRVVRSCGYITDEERDNKQCLRRSGTHEVTTYYCSCTTDLCNGATTPVSQPATFLMTFLVVFFTATRSL